MADFFIFHYEDEPQRVTLPGVIETSLCYLVDVSACRCEESSDAQHFMISYTKGALEHSICYVIEETIAGAERRAGVLVDEVLLHLVDRKIGADAEAGQHIVGALKAKGVPHERIWMITAYEAEARRDLRLAGLQIYPKPPPVADMVQTILGFLHAEERQ